MITSTRRFRFGLTGLLFASAALRAWLAAEGGQDWWPDESRFGVAREAASKMMIGHVPGALRLLFGSADHLGFKLLSLPIAFAVNAGAPIWVAAVYLGLFSVGSLWVISSLALMTSGDEATAWWSACFAAASASLFYYTRQLFPYDPALFWCLLGLMAGVRSRPLLLGICCGYGFLTYNGYWHVAAVCAAAGVLWPQRGWPRKLVAAAWAGFGLALPVMAAILVARLLGKDLIASYVEFSKTITLGDFNEGWSFPWAYLWACEGWLLPLWCAALLAAVIGLCRAQRRYLWRWSAVLAAVYLGLAVPSAVFHKFVVYGRTARSLTPFFALVCGGVAASLLERVRRRTAAGWALGLLLVVLAWPHFQGALAQWYPDRFIRRAEQIEAARTADGRLRMINAWFLHHPEWISTAPIGETLFARPHPMQYAPFMYENQPTVLRRAYWKQDMTMRLARVATPPIAVPGLPAGFAGPTRLTVTFSDLVGPEPLVTTGRINAADCLYVERVRHGVYRFGLRHSFASDRVSAEVPLAFGLPHRVDVSLGSLLPPLSSPWYASHPPWRPLARRLWVLVDGVPVFDAVTDFAPALPGQSDFGYNLVGQTILPTFRGELRSVAALPADGRAGLLAATREWDGQIAGLPQDGYPRTLRLTLTLPSTEIGTGDPLVTTGRAAAGDVLSLVRLGRNRFQLRLDHWHAAIQESAPFEEDESAPHVVEVGMPSLCAPGAGLAAGNLVVRIDGRTVYERRSEGYPAAPAEIVVGRNPIGATTAVGDYGGTILAVDAEP